MQRNRIHTGLAVTVLVLCGWPTLQAQELNVGKDTSQATSENALSYSPPAWPEAPDTRAMLTRLGMGTVTVLGLCVSTLWAAKRWLRGPAAKSCTGNELRLLETVVLGNRCSVFLLVAGRQRFLVATDSSGLKSVVTVPELFQNALAEVPSLEDSVANQEDRTDADLCITNA